MNDLLINSLVSGCIAAAMIVVFDGYGNRADRDDKSSSMVIEAQHSVIDETNDAANFQQVMNGAMMTLKNEIDIIKVEIESLRSRQSKLSHEGKIIESVISASTVGEQGVNPSAKSMSADDVADDNAGFGGERFYTLDDAMNVQEPDSTWDSDATERLTVSLQDADLQGSYLQGVVCQGTMCRAEIYHENEEAAVELFDGEQALIPWDYKGVIETAKDESGDIVTIMYITREGFDFPGGS